MTGKACGQPKTSVPWSKITTDPADFIAVQYLPRRIILNEPTRMEGTDLTTLLEWWQDCEVNNPGDVLNSVLKSGCDQMEKPATGPDCNRFGPDRSCQLPVAELACVTQNRLQPGPVVIARLYTYPELVPYVDYGQLQNNSFVCIVPLHQFNVPFKKFLKLIQVFFFSHV